MRFYTWTASEEDKGQRVQKFCVDRLEIYSGKQVKQAIERNALKVNGIVERHSSRRLLAGDRIEFDSSLFSLIDPAKELVFDKRRLLYDDHHFLVYDKPAAITSVEDGLLPLMQKHDPTLLNVHRLDKDTTGAIIFCKGEAVKEAFVELFRSRTMEKEYLAIVDGVVEEPSGVCDKPIGKLYQSDGHVIWGCKPLPRGGSEARTEWEVLERGEIASLLLCRLITGRTHQIRIHLSERKNPILGDTRYGKVFHSDYQPPHHLLHAWKLSFDHPITGQPLHLRAPPPPEFLDAYRHLFSGRGELLQ